MAEVALGAGTPDEVYLVDDPDSDLGGQTVSRSFAGANTWASSLVDGNGWHVHRARVRAAHLIAGDLARSIALGAACDADDVVTLVEDDPETTDMQKLRRLVAFLESDERDAFLLDSFALAERALRACWADVERMAVALHEHGHLDRDAILDLVGPGTATVAFAVDYLREVATFLDSH